MSISKYPSLLSLPQINPGVSSVLEYLIVKFPNISQNIWQQRMHEGKVHWHDGSLISVDTPFRSQQRVYYYREVETELVIPFEEEILFQDEHILVAHKPHFLPVIPGGKYIDECLQNRLRKKTGIENLQALHRLDRPTAGLVLFSTNIESRHRYHQLFEENKIHKTYLAIATTIEAANSEDELVGKLIGKRWQVKNRITRITNGESRFLMEVVSGVPNSHSEIRCLKQTNDKRLFELNPITGKTHQLRKHMQVIGWPILNDRYYPTLQPETADDFSQPLQLLAKELQFVDPVTNVSRIFTSNAHLKFE